MLLLLVERELLSETALAALESSPETRVLVAPRGGVSGAPWVTADHQESRSLEEWLTDPAVTAPRPAENPVIGLWRKPGDGPAHIVSRVDALARDWNVAMGVVLFGPLDPSADSASLEGLTRFANLRTIFYVGNEDTDGYPVELGRRAELLESLLQVLVAGGRRAADELGFFPADAGPNRFTAFGLASWAPRMARIRDLLHRFAFDVLHRQLTTRRAAVADEDRVLRQLPEALLGRLRLLDVPVSEGVDGAPVRYPDRLPPLPGLPFRDWPCPMVRSRALDDGSDTIRRYRHDLLEYYPRLVSELARLGSEIRRNGQVISVRAGREVRSQVAAAETLAGLATLLRTYFAEFELLAGSRRSQSPSPCPAASDPGHAECLRRFVEEGREHLEEQVQVLPTLRTWAVVSGAALLLLVATGYLLSRGVSPKPGLVPGGLGVLLAGGMILWAWLKTREVARAMERFYDDCATWLRERFVAKLEWVLGQTHRTIETQVIADARALGRRLAERFDLCFRDWEQVLKVPPSGNPEDEIRGLGFTVDLLQTCRDRITDLARDIVRAATDPSIAPATDRHLVRLIEDLSALVMEAAVNSPVPYDRIRDELSRCSRERVQPPILARLAPVQLQSGLVKTFALPHAYGDEVAGPLRAGGSGVVTRVLLAHLPGPAVWLARPHLDVSQLGESLRMSALPVGGTP